MPRQIIIKARFERVYYRLSEQNLRMVDAGLKDFEDYLKTGKAPVGLGIKHLGSKTYEFRVSLALRVLYILDEDRVILAFLGTHDELNRFLKNQ